jgi:Holliday junction resolvase
MNPTSAKKKGKYLESHVADLIRLKGLDNRAYRDGASGAGNREKGDVATSITILGRNICIECKNQKTSKFPKWWKQCETAALKTSSEPVLITKYDREPLEAAKVTIYLDTFLDLVKRAKEPTKVDAPSRELRWHLERLKQDAGKVIKLLEE